MRRVAILIVSALVALAQLAGGSAAPAQDQAPPAKNLFAPPATGQGGEDAAVRPSTVQRTIAFVQARQRELYRRLAGSLRAIKTGPSTATVAALAVLSFLYGVFHAAGPGHGKAVISAYLLANERAVRRGIGLSFAASLAQAVSAILVVSAVVFALEGLGVTTRQPLSAMTAVSAGLIVAIGLWMLWSSLRSILGRGGRTADHASCGHDHHVHEHPPADSWSLGKAASIVAAIGFRPCSGAIFVLLFANSIGLYLAGVWSTFAMAFGTAITVSALAVLTLISKRAAVRLAGGRGRWVGRVYGALSLGGSLAVLALGILLLIASSGPEPPFPAG